MESVARNNKLDLDDDPGYDPYPWFRISAAVEESSYMIIQSLLRFPHKNRRIKRDNWQCCRARYALCRVFCHVVNTRGDRRGVEFRHLTHRARSNQQTLISNNLHVSRGWRRVKWNISFPFDDIFRLQICYGVHREIRIAREIYLESDLWGPGWSSWL